MELKTSNMPKDNPIFSVVMPTYNRAKVIQHAIRSVIDQTFTNWELIIIDDGSTDNVSNVIASFAEDRIKYHKIPHCGFVSQVRNAGNKLAKGKYIVVHDSDDMAFPDRLEEIYERFQATDADLVYHGMYNRMFDPYTNSIVRLAKPAQMYSKERLMYEQYIPGQVAYKTEKILETPYDERIRCCDDYQMLLEFALKDYKFVPLFKNLYEYVDSSDSINVNGEIDGSRRKDVGIIISILKEKYNLDAHASLTKNIISTGEIISKEII